MVAIGRILQRLAVSQLLYLSFIRHDIADRDRRWFAECRMLYFANFPWVISDLVRMLFLGTIAWSAPAELYLSSAVYLGVIWLCEVLATPVFSSISAENWNRRLNAMRAFLIFRALGWSLALAISLRYASPSNLSILIVLGTLTIMFDVLYMASVPIIALISAAIMLAGVAFALIGLPGINPTLAIAVLSMQMLGLHFAVFNMYHLFATRRLRTRKLRSANDTIRLLLNQYDEHANDFLVEVDVQGRLQHPSARLCEALGRVTEDLDGISVDELFEPGRELNALIAAGRNLRRFRNMVLPIRIGGERRWWCVSGCPIYDAEGRHQGFRSFVQDVTEKRAAEERVHFMATRDALTGLCNRTIFTHQLEELYAFDGPPPNCALLYIDLDAFKIINDTSGHAAGDAVLRETAHRIAKVIHPGHVIARLGGDEFAILLKSADKVANATGISEALVEALSQPVQTDGRSVQCSASIGIARAPAHGSSADALMRAADIALYNAKSNGRRRCVEFHPDMLNEMQERRKLEMDLRRALERGQFEIHYQPLIDIASRRVSGYEALLRWNHPDRGQISPAEFIPMAERSELIIPIGEWVLREALAEASGWNEDLTIAVNVSPAQMRGDVLLGHVVNALATSGLAPERLELEITETMLMDDCDIHLRTLHQLRNFGVRIALDDFGTGYSSLNYLRSFPFDKLKIDRCFVKDLATNPDCHAIVESVLGLARKFRMETIAEGIEHESQLDVLATMGCQQVQGHLFDKAMPAYRIPSDQRLQNHRRHKSTPAKLPSAGAAMVRPDYPLRATGTDNEAL